MTGTEEKPPAKRKVRRRQPAGKPHDLAQTIYGREDGEFILVLYDPALLPPERVGDLRRLGTFREVVRGAIRGRSMMRVADRLSIGRGTFSHYAYNQKEPRPALHPRVWRELVQLYFTPATEDEGEEVRSWHKP